MKLTDEQIQELENKFLEAVEEEEVEREEGEFPRHIVEDNRGNVRYLALQGCDYSEIEERIPDMVETVVEAHENAKAEAEADEVEAE